MFLWLHNIMLNINFSSCKRSCCRILLPYIEKGNNMILSLTWKSNYFPLQVLIKMKCLFVTLYLIFRLRNYNDQFFFAVQSIIIKNSKKCHMSQNCSYMYANKLNRSYVCGNQYFSHLYTYWNIILVFQCTIFFSTR